MQKLQHINAIIQKLYAIYILYNFDFKKLLGC